MIFRAPYETRGILLDRGQVEAMSAQSDWEQRTFCAFEASVEPRLSSDAEERDAVLSVLWRVIPTRAVTSHHVMVVPIPPRQSPSLALLYRFTFDPPKSQGQRPRLQIEFVCSGAASTPDEAASAPSDCVPGRAGMTFSGFPNSLGSDALGLDQADAHFASHPAEHRPLFQRSEREAPQKFGRAPEVLDAALDSQGRT